MTNVGYNKFALDTRLEHDTIDLGERGICRVLRFDDQRYDWLVLVPQRADCIEFIDLNEADQQQLAADVRWAATLLRQHGKGQKLNVGALGNVVAQLHIHMVLRAPDDPAWPGPVWGHSPAQRFTPVDAAKEQHRWRRWLELD
ncbi:diadenosine tetraphosphate hydrolase [Pseudidiomarina aestuarii]|uniref:Diadenosine tetraphosphate hydrolase n=1 Tax=Pseudidiomarina aestuarii TaxID=624146 RepID=A0A7Z6ZUB0_9GAMM|nr:HIT domain-containing protein [Pseudidiomarina aestuarii]RUO41478.1 diadenosine tetraphosphate hydrolase [Pseudidiomarina aestuarii]